MADPSPNLSPTPEIQQQPQTPPRSYRRNNWTAQETQTLITAIRLNDERRSTAPLSTHRVRRFTKRCWMWVENYCYPRGCRRSQMQCNDKWDNLIRCYRKVHEYQSHSARTKPGSGNWKSYWDMEGHEKKELNLPTKMEFDIYQGITDILNLHNACQNTVSSTPITMIPPPPPQQPPMDLSPPLAVTQAATQTEDPDKFFGPGTVENIKCHIKAFESQEEIDAVFVNTILSGIQLRNLEMAWKKPIMDRVGLIIEIFHVHAEMKEAKLQN